MNQSTQGKVEMGQLHLLTVQELQDIFWEWYMDKALHYPTTSTEVLPNGTPVHTFTPSGIDKVNDAIESYLEYLNEENTMLGSSLEDLESFFDYALMRAYEPDCEPVDYELPF